MFVYDKNDFFGTASVHVESEALKKKSNELGKMGYGAMSRLVYRPLHDTGDCFSWVFPVLTKHLDTIANLHLTILALTWGLISRRVLQKSEL